MHAKHRFTGARQHGARRPWAAIDLDALPGANVKQER